MSFAQPQQAPGAERRISPVPINTGTNNPFRRGTNSPAPSPGIATSPTRRPGSSRNPFLDDMEGNAPKPSMSPQRPPRTRPVRSPTETEGLLANMSLDDRMSEEATRPRMMNGDGRPRSREQSQNADKLDIFADPPARRPPPGYRPRRRNSDTSVADRRSIDEDDARRKERRRRERGSTMKDGQGRPVPSKDLRGKKPSRKLDVIDKLDVTSIYGTGLFHHDGPFDACNPHRNRKGATKAPMSAFAKDSLNNAIGGAGPLNKNIDLDRFHGHQEDSFKDFSSAATRDQPPFEQYMPGLPGRPSIRADSIRADSVRADSVDRASHFNPTSKVERLHGDESLGLGTTTFLDGAPAAKAAIARRESEGDSGIGGLGRKKSLAQRIRGINGRPRGNSSANGTALASPEPRYERTTSPISPTEHPVSAGGVPRSNEKNPFFQDYDDAYERKGTSIKAEEQKKDVTGAAIQVTSPDAPTPIGEGSEVQHGAPYQLKRSLTEGGSAHQAVKPPPQAEEEGKIGGGFLDRVKSLRTGKGKRPERFEK